MGEARPCGPREKHRALVRWPSSGRNDPAARSVVEFALSTSVLANRGDGVLLHDHWAHYTSYWKYQVHSMTSRRMGSNRVVCNNL